MTRMTDHDLYQHLTDHAFKWGYGSLTSEERQFLFSYRKSRSKGPVLPRVPRQIPGRGRHGRIKVTKAQPTWSPSAIDVSFTSVDSCSADYQRVLGQG